MTRRKTSAKRKLMPQSVLHEILCKANEGVPIARLLRNYELDLTRTTLASLLQQYALSATSLQDQDTILASLFPPWLDEYSETSSKVQQNPDGWYYQGYFPWGEWKQENDKNN